MNTIKFSSIYDLKKETNNVEIYDIKKIKINGKDYKCYSNAQMSLYVTKKCNANCKFCINKYEERYRNALELDDDNYFKSLNNVLDCLKSVNPKITITGGEPTKSNRLVNILRLLKEKGFKLRTFSTNATGLLDRFEGKTILSHMISNNAINNINISRMSIDDEINKKLMNVNQSNELIKSVFTFGKVNNMDMRLSCYLQKDGVNDLDSILEYNDFYERIGVETIIFRELVSLKNASHEYNDSIIKIDKIFEDIKNDPRFKYIKTENGMYYKVNIYRYKDKLVKCYQEKSGLGNKPSDDIIREFVFYPDGNLDSGWNKKNGIILKGRSENNE